MTAKTFNNLTEADLKQVYDNAKRDVRVACDEFHAHSALQGCITGPEHAVAVCKLVEQLLRIQGAAAVLAEVVPC